MQLSDHPSLQSNIDKRKSKNLELLKKITKFCEENNWMCKKLNTFTFISNKRIYFFSH